MTSERHGPTTSRLRLRPNLRSSLHDNNGTSFYLIEDPSGGGFYRLGSREWGLACQLDGTRTLADAATSTECQNSGRAMSPPEVESVGRFLLAEGLATMVTPDAHTCPNTAMPTRAQRRVKLNPFFIRIPLIYPDRLLEAALPRCRWLTSRPILAVWLMVVIWAGYCVISQWHRFTDAALTYLAPSMWVYLWLVWFGLKIIHEFFHGLFCKKYGGDVGAAGVALILFSPIAYVDVTSAWRIRSKWQRISISAAGIYVELLIAGIAAILWSQFEEGTISHVCHSVVLMASFTTILFNANPLMRFDGYYILSDLLEIQNLYGAGQQFVRGLLRRFYLGLSTNLRAEKSLSRRLIVNVYGVAAAIWRIIICLSLILLASTLFHGAGLVIALFGVVSWIAMPCVRLAKFLVQGRPHPDRLRFVVMTTLTCVFAFAVLWLPWPGGASVPAVVVYAPEGIVRVATEGFIESVSVTSGQYVKAKQVLVKLRNEELEVELADVRMAVQQSLIRARILHRDDALAAYQAELERAEAMKERQKHLQSQVDDLVVRAPMEGYVLGKRLQDLVGQFLEVGIYLMTVVDEGRKEIQISIPETHIDTFSQKLGSIPRVRVLGRRGKVRAGPLARIEPRASVIVRNSALSALHGGPLATKEQSGETESNSRGSEFQLTTPRIHGVVALPAQESLRLRSGQLAKVRIHDSNEALGRRTFRAAKTWIQRKLNMRATAQI